MATTVKTGWLHNKNGDKFAPKTLTSQVQTSDGVLLEDKIQTALDDKSNIGHTHTVDNITDLTATVTELNYMDGVTSNVQTQLDGKADSSHNHDASNIASGTLSSDRLPTVPIAKGGTGATTAADALSNLGAASKPSATTVTLPTYMWDSTSLTQTVPCPGILQDETAQLITVAPSSSSMTAVISSGTYCSGQGANSLTFTCTTIPTEALVFNVGWQDCDHFFFVRTIIGFTVGFTTFRAYEGMTWHQWVASEYNTKGFFEDDSRIVISVTDNYLYYVGGVSSDDIILPGSRYVSNSIELG